MKQDKTTLPTRLEANGVCIQAHDWSELNVARIRFPRGADATPLLVGLPGNLCQCPHWGYVLSGAITSTDAAGQRETVKDGDLFYWPPGHNVHVERDAEIVMFSPQHEHSHVIDHMKAVAGA